MNAEEQFSAHVAQVRVEHDFIRSIAGALGFSLTNTSVAYVREKALRAINGSVAQDLGRQVGCSSGCVENRRELGVAMGLINGMYAWADLKARGRTLVSQIAALTRERDQARQDCAEAQDEIHAHVDETTRGRNRLGEALGLTAGNLNTWDGLAAKAQELVHHRYALRLTLDDTARKLADAKWDEETRNGRWLEQQVADLIREKRQLEVKLGEWRRVFGHTPKDGIEALAAEQLARRGDSSRVVARVCAERDAARQAAAEGRLEVARLRSTLANLDPGLSGKGLWNPLPDSACGRCGHGWHADHLCNDTRCSCMGNHDADPGELRDLGRLVNE
jgi:hypothetical protein